jgi:amidase
MEDLLLSGSVGALRAAIVAKKISVAEVTRWYLHRIETLNASGPALNAVRTVAPDAMKVARERDEALAKGQALGPLHGIPVLLKDNILTGDGMSASAGAAALAAFVPRKDATTVRKLREAGAIVFGKTNLTEFADYVSEVMPSGFSGAGGTVKNPQTREDYGRGLGSSVGSVAAVAAALAPVALGSETQNSIQTPASVSSVYGFKPSVGMVSRAGIVPLVPSQDSPGPLARSVEDAALVFSVIAGPDSADPATQGIGLERSLALRPRDPKSIRIGVPRRTIADRADVAGMLPQFEAALAELAKAGVTIIDPCDLPAADQLAEVRSCVFRTEFKAALNDFLRDNGSPCGIGTMDALIAWNGQHPDAIPFGQSLLIAAAQTAGLNDPAYIADRHRDIMLSREVGIGGAMKACGADVLIAPMGAAAKCTGKAGAPVLAIPIGRDGAGLPAGITLFSMPGNDAVLLDIGATVAKIIGERVLPQV